MKRNFIIIALAFIFCTNSFSQRKENTFNLQTGKTVQKQAVFIDLFPSMEGVWEGKVGGGLFYERYIHPSFSIVGEANVYTDFDDENVFSVYGHGRMYPFQTTLGKLFADVGFGYRRSTLEDDNIRCLEASVSAGWKFIIGRGFIIEPNVGYRRNVYTIKGHESKKGGITLNLSFGWAF